VKVGIYSNVILVFPPLQNDIHSHQVLKFYYALLYTSIIIYEFEIKRKGYMKNITPFKFENF